MAGRILLGRLGGLLLLAMVSTSCGTIALQMYEGPPKPEAEVSIVRLWGPAVLVQKIDGKDALVRGTESHAYLLPGEHTFQIKRMKILGMNLLCGMLCDAIFNAPTTLTARTEPGRVYTFKFMNDEVGSVVIEHRGPDYDRVCLDPRRYRDGKNC